MQLIRKQSGFTLIELMITVAIIGILSSIAYPSYIQYTLRANRSVATSAMLDIAQKQERNYIDNRTYAALTSLGFAATTVGVNRNNVKVAENAGIYNLTMTTASATAFTIQATATATQASDTGCTTLTLSVTGAKTPIDCWQ